MIRKLLLVTAGLVLLAGAFALPAVGITVEELAWARALRLAQIPQVHYEVWRRPNTRVIYRPRYIPVDLNHGVRLCGQMMPVYEGDTPQTQKLVFYVEVYIRQSEAEVLLDALTHEYLHALWVARAIHDEAWFNQNPDSEIWVRNLVPADCPAW